MDAPLLVGCHKVKNDGLVAVIGDITVTGQSSLVRRSSVLSKLLTEGSHPTVVLVELLAAGNRAPRQEQVLVLPESHIRNFVVFRAGPVRRAEGLSRTMRQIIKGDLIGDVTFGKEACIHTALILNKGPASEGERTVGFRRHTKNEVGGIDIRFHLRTPLGHAFLNCAV